MSNIIKTILDKGVLVKIKKNKYMCVCKNWFLIVIGTDEQREFQLYFNSILINTEYTYNEVFNDSELIDIQEFMIKRNFN